jgi:hypothetical protein
LPLSLTKRRLLCHLALGRHDVPSTQLPDESFKYFTLGLTCKNNSGNFAQD